MKIQLAGLLLAAVVFTLSAAVPPPPAPPTPGKSPAIKEPVRPLNPQAPSNVSTRTNSTRVQEVPGTKAPELLPSLPVPGSTLIAPPTANTNRPAAPGVLTLPGGPSAATGTNVTLPKPSLEGMTNAAGELVLDPTTTRFQAAPLEQVMEVYSELTGRTVLRSPAVNFDQIKITLNTKTPLTRAESIQAIDSILALNSIVVIPTGTKFLTVVPSANAFGEAAAFNTNSMHELPEASQYITKIVQVTNAKPSEIVAAIQPFAKLQGGILPIDATGVIVLRDNAINIKRMLEVLAKIDVVVPTDEEFKVIPINYALAADVAQVLGSFTTSGPSAGGTTGSRTGSSSTTRRTGTTSPFGGNTGLPGAPGASPFGTQPGINPAAPGAAQPGTVQTQFQQRLNQIVSNITGGRGGGAPLLGEAKIIPYDRSNSLLVLANKAELAMLTKLLKEIDVPQQQVLIEALIFETDIGHQLDINFGLGQKTANPGAQFSGRGGINSIINFSTNTTVLGVGATTGGFGYLAQIGANWAAAVQMLESDSKTEVLSRPRIQTSHAEAANIFSGGTTPYVTGSVSGAGFGTQQQIQQLQIGISMSVLPLITSDGLVVLDINQTIEGENGTVAIDANLRVPKTVRHTAQAKVAVHDGETIILGGLIRTAKTRSVTGVPVLKDIPGLGALFRSTSENPTRKELMVLIRPTVLATPKSASLAAQAERSQSSSIRAVERSVREQNGKIDAEMEKAEIEHLRKEMEKKSRTKEPFFQFMPNRNPPAAPIPAPAPAPEKKESTDLFEVPRTTPNN
ncbi:MAG: hypothetical protein B9S33_03375 [Pedosphaera sp. Tous-C6FEB]|nr:MAG: hypothetical protein B9S33_03375 [Pedosphaera sp. Tous-C6FEB]